MLENVIQADGGVVHHLQGVGVVLTGEVSHAPATTLKSISHMAPDLMKLYSLTSYDKRYQLSRIRRVDLLKELDYKI